MTEEQKNDNDLKQEITSLRSKLDELNKNKEEWFTKKEELKNQISELIDQVKDIRTEKEDFEKNVREFKVKRDRFNTEVKKLIDRVKILNKQKKDMLAKLNIKVDPTSIKKKIEQYELQIETQGLSFDKEKKVMKLINSLKKQFDQTKGIQTILDEIDVVSKKIEEAKKNGDEFHVKLKDYAKENKKRFSDFLNTSKEINKLKKVQEEAFDKFINFKQEFAALNKELKKKLDVANKSNEVKKKDRAEKVKAKKRKDEEKIQQKAEAVEEKLKSKSKKKKILTTEDIIAFQGKIADPQRFDEKEPAAEKEKEE